MNHKEPDYNHNVSRLALGLVLLSVLMLVSAAGVCTGGVCLMLTGV